MCVGGRGEAEAAGEWGVVGEEEEEEEQAGVVVQGDSGSHTRKARASIICSALLRRWWLLQMSDYGSASHSAHNLKDKTQPLSALRPTD